MAGSVCVIRLSIHAKERLHHRTGTANIHFALPIPLNFAFTQRPVDKPAESPGLKFPGRAIAPLIQRTFSDDPTGLPAFFPLLHGKEKEGLPFHMSRNGSPALFIALNCFGGRPQELCHLSLCFTQLGSNA
jgi:hypothetical protein